MKSTKKSKFYINFIAIVLVIASVMMLGLIDIQTLAHSSIIDIDAKVVSRATIEENFSDVVKKILLLGIALCMSFSLAACTQDEVEPMGTLCSLQVAYDGGLLTVGDLQSIANYHNNGIEYAEALDANIELAIKETAAEVIRTRESNPHMEASAADVSIVGYYRTYNDSVAVIVNDSFTDYPAVIWEETIESVTFVYSGANIIIWKNS